MVSTLILITIYILSGLAWYFSVRYEHLHYYKNINPGFLDFIVVFIPVLNTAWSFLAWANILFNKLDDEKIDTSKFFGIKQ